MQQLETIHRKLYRFFGPQHWWPADTPFEVMVGAILTQNTNWSNVERAISHLKRERVLSPHKLRALKLNKLIRLIRPSGYYNIKAKRLRSFLDFFFQQYQGDIRRMAAEDLVTLRKELLKVKGIGPETADSIFLYALNKPVFVVDAYTKRIFSRHNFIPADTEYNQVQMFFMQNLKKSVRLFNEYHALLVKLGKEFCLKNNPICNRCPLR